MGFYLQTSSNHNKAMQLIDQGAKRIEGEPTFPPPEGQVLVCVVKNGPFDAAAIAFSLDEFHEFIGHYTGFDDPRPRTWLLMPEDQVLEQLPHIKKELDEGRIN